MTKEEIDVLIKEYAKRAEEHVRNCEPLDRAECERRMKHLYKVCGLREPKIVFCASPRRAQQLKGFYDAVENYREGLSRMDDPPGVFKDDLLKEVFPESYEKYLKIKDKKRFNYLWHKAAKDNYDNFESYMAPGQYGIIRNFAHEFCVKAGNNNEINIPLLEANLAVDEVTGAYLPFDTHCFIIERPISIHFDENFRLHNENGPAFEYIDGYKKYYVNGIEMPEYLIETPAEKLDIDFFLEERRADVRTYFVKKKGVESMLEMGKLIDTHENYKGGKYKLWHASEYKLYDMEKLFPHLEYVPYVYMKNQTTGVFHLEAVSPKCQNLEEALKERFGGRNLIIKAIK
ncbi:MAG TPA: hypothetical protein VIK96_04660 [Bacilli bacterium]